MTRKKAVQALGDQKTKAAATQVADLLSQALELAQEHGSVGWVTAWLDDRDELEGYGYTVELKEQIEGLEEKLSDACERLAVWGRTVRGGSAIPLDLSIVEQVKVEEFFRNLRDPERLSRPTDRVEELLERCRGFRVEELEKVLGWMDSYRLGELPFGPTDELRDQVRELERKLEKAAEKFDRQATRMEELDKAIVGKSLELGSFHLLLKDPRMAFVRDHLPELSLEALQWIVEQETAT